jgi:hypothetical protein
VQPRAAPPWARRAEAVLPAAGQPSAQPEEAAGEQLLAEPAVGAAEPWARPRVVEVAVPWVQQRAAAEEPVSTAVPRQAVA